MKTAISVDDIIRALEAIKDTNTNKDVIEALDPGVKHEELYYFHNRMLFYKNSSIEKITIGQAAALVLREEQVKDATIAIALYGYCNFHFGRKTRQHNQDDQMGRVLDVLAKEFEGRVDVIKVDLRDGKSQKE